MLDRGDLLLSFLDTAEDEMAKPLQQASLPRLQTLLDLGEPCLHSEICFPHYKVCVLYPRV